MYLKNFSKTLVAILLFSGGFAHAQISSLFNTTRPKSMSQRWELDTVTSSGTFVITPYKPVYILPVRFSSSPNGKPYSGNPGEGYVQPDNTDYNRIEAKFQISFKVKVAQGLFWGHGDLWGAYTQKSAWQVYNPKLSRPFRETNYEPEVILNFATNFNLFGFKNRMLGVSFNHQSNGRGLPLSRSWNRVILQAGFERDNWQVYLRPWFRMPDDTDDNPDIVDRVGRGDVTLIYSMGKNIFSFTGTSNFEPNKNFSGLAEGTWSHEIKGNLKGFIQVTHGYGEMMIDYNHRQTTIGLGISLVEWL